MAFRTYDREMRCVIVLALLASATPTRAEMRCEDGPLPPQGIGNQTKVAGSGGVIVAGNTLPDWRFRDVNRIVRARVTTVAPGLAIYHPPPLADRAITLEDTAHAARVRTTRVFEADPPLAVPRVRSVTSVGTVTMLRKAVTVEFATAVPEGAVVAVITRVDGAKRVGLSWVEVHEGLSAVPIWHSPRSCETHVESWIQPQPGDVVDVQWIDASGRLSEPSEPVTVVRANAPK